MALSEMLRDAPKAAVVSASEDLRQQVEFCLSDTYVALCNALRTSITKDASKGASVPLSVVVNTLPTAEAKPPELASVRAALLSCPDVEIDDSDNVICHGKLSPNGSRVRECRRKSVVVDGIPDDSTAESVHQLLAGCGRLVSVGVCHPRHTAFYAKGTFHSRNVHGIAQFSTVQEAIHAVSTMNISWRGGPRVTHLMKEFRPPSPLKPRNQNVVRDTPTPTDSSSNDGSTNGENLQDCDMLENLAMKPKQTRGKKNRGKNDSENVNLQGSKRSEQPAVRHARREFEVQAVAAPETRSHPRRFVNSKSPTGAPGASATDGVHPRRPRGPDGTRGFTMGRGRPLMVAA